MATFSADDAICFQRFESTFCVDGVRHALIILNLECSEQNIPAAMVKMHSSEPHHELAATRQRRGTGQTSSSEVTSGGPKGPLSVAERAKAMREQRSSRRRTTVRLLFATNITPPIPLLRRFAGSALSTIESCAFSSGGSCAVYAKLGAYASRTSRGRMQLIRG